MPSKKHYRINLLVDDKMRFILSDIRAVYPTLSDSDLIKMAVGGFYTQNIAKLPVYYPTPEEAESINQGIASITGNEKTYTSAQELIDDLDKDD